MFGLVLVACAYAGIFMVLLGVSMYVSPVPVQCLYRAGRWIAPGNGYGRGAYTSKIRK